MKCFEYHKEGTLGEIETKKHKDDRQNTTSNVANVAKESTSDVEAILCVTTGSSENE